MEVCVVCECAVNVCRQAGDDALGVEERLLEKRCEEAFQVDLDVYASS